LCRVLYLSHVPVAVEAVDLREYWGQVLLVWTPGDEAIVLVKWPGSLEARALDWWVVGDGAQGLSWPLVTGE
jgi:hypothetical protein